MDTAEMISQLEGVGKWGPDERRTTSGAIRHTMGSDKWHTRRRVLVEEIWLREFDPTSVKLAKQSKGGTPTLPEMIAQLTAAGEMPSIERMIDFFAREGCGKPRNVVMREQWDRVFRQ